MSDRRSGEETGRGSGGPPEGPDRPLSALLADLVAAPARELPGAYLPMLHPGARLGRYEILQELGRGGFGVVYEALDPELRREVAIKVLRPARRRLGEAEAQRLRAEAVAVAGLDHPGIVTLHDLGTCEAGPFLVLERLRGETLDARLSRGPLPPRQAVWLATEVARALSHAHRRGVLHLDLKPANVFLTEDGRIKLLDFGLAGLLGLLGSAGQGPGGTPGYVAPEQVRGDDVDARADVFAFGVLVHEALEGRPPFEVRDGRSAALDGAAPARGAAAVPPALARLLERCLCPDREGRPASGEAVLEALLALERPLDPGAAEARGPAGGVAPGDGKAAGGGIRPAPARRRARPTLRWAAAALLAAVLLAAVAFFVLRESPVDSVAVLPLANETGDGSIDYVADGITEGLIDSLSQLPGLRVMARSTVFAYRGRTVTPREAGRELQVATVITGLVRRSGDVLTVEVELAKVADGSRLWGRQTTWKLADILATQGELAAQVSDALRPRQGEAQRIRQERRQPESAAAYLLYLRGRAAALDSWTADGFRKGIDYLNRATRLDPTYALAFAGLASTYYDASGVSLRPEEAMPLAKAAATRALALDGDLAEAHVALGQVLAEYEWQWSEAELHYRRALQLNPNLTQAHVYFGFWLAHQGHLDSAIEELQAARRLDPLTTFPAMALAHYLYVARRTDEAIAVSRKAITADPGFYMTHSVLGMAYEQKGLLPEALAEFEEARRLDPGQPFTLGYLGHVLATAGRRAEALQMAEALEHHQGPGYVDPFAVAIVHAGLGDRDRAFTWLEAAFRVRSESLLHYKDAPLLDGLRSDPRFADLVRRMGLAKDGGAAPHG